MGANYKGSCTYVAIASILSYYDNYLDDGIIPEQYDSVPIYSNTNIVSHNDSPGTNDTYEKKDFDSLGLKYDTNVSKSIINLNADEYYRLIESKKNVSLHAKLITIGKNLGYYDFQNDETPCSLGLEGAIAIINAYLNELGLQSGKHYNVGYTGSNSSAITNHISIGNFVRGCVGYGSPVILMSRNLSSAHSTVAYDYDDNYIYVNMGWTSGMEWTESKEKTYYPIEESYPYFIVSICLEFNPQYFTHQHTNNYAVRNLSMGLFTDYYCYCNCNIFTYKYVDHSYDDHYIDYNENQHKAYCRCNKYILETHEYEIHNVGLSLNSIWMMNPLVEILPNCVKCGHTRGNGGGTIVTGTQDLTEIL